MDQWGKTSGKIGKTRPVTQGRASSVRRGRRSRARQRSGDLDFGNARLRSALLGYARQGQPAPASQCVSGARRRRRDAGEREISLRWEFVNDSSVQCIVSVFSVDYNKFSAVWMCF